MVRIPPGAGGRVLGHAPALAVRGQRPPMRAALRRSSMPTRTLTKIRLPSCRFEFCRASRGRIPLPDPAQANAGSACAALIPHPTRPESRVSWTLPCLKDPTGGQERTERFSKGLPSTASHPIGWPRPGARHLQPVGSKAQRQCALTPIATHDLGDESLSIEIGGAHDGRHST